MAPPTDIAKMIADYRHEHDGVREAREHQLQIVLEGEIAKLAAMLPVKQQQQQKRAPSSFALTSNATAVYPNHNGSVTGSQQVALGSQQQGFVAFRGSISTTNANQSTTNANFKTVAGNPTTTAPLPQQQAAPSGGASSSSIPAARMSTAAMPAGGAATADSADKQSREAQKLSLIAEFNQMFGPKTVAAPQQPPASSDSAEQERKRAAMEELKKMYAR